MKDGLKPIQEMQDLLLLLGSDDYLRLKGDTARGNIQVPILRGPGGVHHRRGPPLADSPGAGLGGHPHKGEPGHGQGGPDAGPHPEPGP